MPFCYRTTRRAGSVASAAERAGAAGRRAEGPWALSISTAASSEETTTMNPRLVTSVRQAWRALSIRHRRLPGRCGCAVFVRSNRLLQNFGRSERLVSGILEKGGGSRKNSLQEASGRHLS